MSTDDIFDDEPKGSRARRVEDKARHLSQMNGGEPEDFMDAAEQLSGRKDKDKPYNDDHLTSAGYKIVAVYDYTDREGNRLYQVLRYEHPGVPGAKEFRQRRPGRDGVWLADAGWVKVPFRWPQIAAAPPDREVWLVEGEKDALRGAELGLETTAVAGSKMSPAIAKALTGKHVVICADNDEPGRNHEEEWTEALRGFATTIRIVRLPGMGRTGDLSDFIDRGGTLEQLLTLRAAALPQGKFLPTPFVWCDASKIPLREWIYQPCYIRKFVTTTISPTGWGKSSLILVEAIAMASGKALLGIRPAEPVRVWYWNGEEHREELDRRVAAICKHYKLTESDLDGRLFIDTGRRAKLTIAKTIRYGLVEVDHTQVRDLIEGIRERKIDVLMIDPLISAHRIKENVNEDLDLVVKTFADIADETGCAVHIAHHTRKTGGAEITVEDARGGGSFQAAARTKRMINRMSQREAENAEIDLGRRRFYFRTDFESNLMAPAEEADWYESVSEELNNGFPGDEIGVVRQWRYPRVDQPRFTAPDVERALAAVREGGPWRADQRSTKEPWVGEPIARALCVDITVKTKKKMMSKLVSEWLVRGWLIRVKRADQHRQQRDYVEAGQFDRAAVENQTAAAVRRSCGNQTAANDRRDCPESADAYRFAAVEQSAAPHCGEGPLRSPQ
jgi:hypothetical protein